MLWRNLGHNPDFNPCLKLASHAEAVASSVDEVRRSYRVQPIPCVAALALVKLPETTQTTGGGRRLFLQVHSPPAAQKVRHRRARAGGD